MAKCDFNKVAKQPTLHGCFLVNLPHIFRTPFLRTPFLEKGILKICAKFVGDHPCRSAISMKLLCDLA